MSPLHPFRSRRQERLYRYSLGFRVRYPRCRSFRFRGGWFVRCTWDRDHVARGTKWHADEAHTGNVWLVRSRSNG